MTNRVARRARKTGLAYGRLRNGVERKGDLSVCTVLDIPFQKGPKLPNRRARPGDLKRGAINR